METLYFTKFSLEEIFNFIKKNKERKIFNFLNQHDIYNFKNNNLFRESLNTFFSINIIDGSFLTFFLSIKKFKKISRVRGPTFTRELLLKKELSSSKKHFFIGLEKEDLKVLIEKFSHLKKVDCYNPPYIKDVVFSDEEIEKISKKINKFKPDFVWVGIASPKQNILSYQLFKKTNAKYFFNVGAAMDFLLGKKKEAPSFVRKIGVEWFYRLITDFKYSKKKVWRSFIAVFYLLFGKIKIDLKKGIL
ncbi:MAG: WecB/TagA/CpsF family glycosyltransferase [Candidatus Pacearchaeota archaeon]